MNSHKKNLIISPVVGVLAYLVLGYVQHQTLKIPSTPQDLIELAVIIGAVMLGAFFHARGPVYVSDAEEETGTVKWFNVKKGYGFITRDQGDDVFVHYRNILGEGRRAIAEGQRVRFIVIPGDKGLQADEVEAI
jgi:CspA family cold shock protein